MPQSGLAYSFLNNSQTASKKKRLQNVSPYIYCTFQLRRRIPKLLNRSLLKALQSRRFPEKLTPLLNCL